MVYLAFLVVLVFLVLPVFLVLQVFPGLLVFPGFLAFLDRLVSPFNGGQCFAKATLTNLPYAHQFTTNKPYGPVVDAR